MKTKLPVLLLILLMISISSIAQPPGEGSFVGGSMNFSVNSSSEVEGNSTVDGPSTTRFSLQPMYGMFISETMAIGGWVGFNVNSTKTPIGDDDRVNTQTLFSLNPFVRNYFTTSKFGFYGEGILGLEFGGSKVKTGNVTNDGPNAFNFAIGVRPGIYYYVTESFALESTIGFFGYQRNQLKYENDDKDIDSTFRLNVNPSSFNFGLVYHF